MGMWPSSVSTVRSNHCSSTLVYFLLNEKDNVPREFLVDLVGFLYGKNFSVFTQVSKVLKILLSGIL